MWFILPLNWQLVSFDFWGPGTAVQALVSMDSMRTFDGMNDTREANWPMETARSHFLQAHVVTCAKEPVWHLVGRDPDGSDPANRIACTEQREDRDEAIHPEAHLP